RIEPGDIIEAEVEFVWPDEVFEGGNDIYSQRGIALFGRVNGEPEIRRCGFRLIYLPNYAARALKDKIREIFPESVRAFMLALLTGDREELYDDSTLTGALSRAGISHIVAVSGMHLSFICGFIALLERRKRRAALIVIPSVLFFMAMTGFSPSVTRAGIMIIFIYTAPLFGRESDSVTSLSAALLLILLINPNTAGNAGLQMSFAASLGMTLTSGRIYDALYGAFAKRKKKRRRLVTTLLHLVISAVASTSGALLFTVPLSAAHFGTISLAAPFVNVLTTAAVSLAFVGGFIACLAGFIFAPVGVVLAHIVSAAPAYIIGTAKLFSRIPFLCASANDPYVLIWIIYIYLMIIVFVAMRTKFRRIVLPLTLAIISLSAVSIITAVRPTVNSEGLTFTVLDVGQGLCCVVESEGMAAVIDCGSSSGEQAGERAVSYLRSRGYSGVDTLIFTHYHSDHCNGAADLMTALDIGAVLGPVGGEEDEYRTGRISALAEDTGTDIIYVESDMTVSLGKVMINLYAPVDDMNENERCVAVLVTCGEYDVLITGDAGSDTERRLMEKVSLPDIETLVVGHHGSRYSTSAELLKKLRPETAIISVGENSYGHPTEETLSRLDGHGIEIFRTDENGSITVCSQ
ncbi:MAG: DNA internalization-related competence protein ComEC/Rec2, partial [Oscillospiraceae bacterium]|nr:DNA internalization-related competence protein ComEC/Rec2 [Oscillospiraceae bacterium]